MGRHNNRHPIASDDRITRVNELLKRTLAEKLESFGFNEGGVLVSVTRVDCATSLKNATVYLSIMGAQNEAQEQKILQSVIKRKAELQYLMSQEVILKYTPVLHFVADHSIAEGDRVLELIRQMEEQENEDSDGNGSL